MGTHVLNLQHRCHCYAQKDAPEATTTSSAATGDVAGDSVRIPTLGQQCCRFMPLTLPSMRLRLKSRRGTSKEQAQAQSSEVDAAEWINRVVKDPMVEIDPVTMAQHLLARKYSALVAPSEAAPPEVESNSLSPVMETISTSQQPFSHFARAPRGLGSVLLALGVAIALASLAAAVHLFRTRHQQRRLEGVAAGQQEPQPLAYASSDEEGKLDLLSLVQQEEPRGAISLNPEAVIAAAVAAAAAAVETMKQLNLSTDEQQEPAQDIKPEVVIAAAASAAAAEAMKQLNISTSQQEKPTQYIKPAEVARAAAAETMKQLNVSTAEQEKPTPYIEPDVAIAAAANLVQQVVAAAQVISKVDLEEPPEVTSPKPEFVKVPAAELQATPPPPPPPVISPKPEVDKAPPAEVQAVVAAAAPPPPVISPKPEVVKAPPAEVQAVVAAAAAAAPVISPKPEVVKAPAAELQAVVATPPPPPPPPPVISPEVVKAPAAEVQAVAPPPPPVISPRPEVVKAPAAELQAATPPPPPPQVISEVEQEEPPQVIPKAEVVKAAAESIEDQETVAAAQVIGKVEQKEQQPDVSPKPEVVTAGAAQAIELEQSVEAEINDEGHVNKVVITDVVVDKRIAIAGASAAAQEVHSIATSNKRQEHASSAANPVPLPPSLLDSTPAPEYLSSNNNMDRPSAPLDHSKNLSDHLFKNSYLTFPPFDTKRDISSSRTEDAGKDDLRLSSSSSDEEDEMISDQEKSEALKKVVQAAAPAMAVGAGAMSFLTGVDGAFEMVGLAATASFISFELLWADAREELWREVKKISDHRKLLEFFKARKIIQSDEIL